MPLGVVKNEGWAWYASRW